MRIPSVEIPIDYDDEVQKPFENSQKYHQTILITPRTAHIFKLQICNENNLRIINHIDFTNDRGSPQAVVIIANNFAVNIYSKPKYKTFSNYCC